MLEKIYSRSATVSELRSGPLGLFVDDFGSLLPSEGYTCEVIETKIAVIRSLHFWLVQRDIPLGHLTSRLIDQFVTFRKWQYQGFTHKGHASTLRAFVALLRSRGLIPPEEPAVSGLSALDKRLKDFGEHLERERGVTAKCREAYCDSVRKFLTSTCGIKASDGATLSPDGISAFIIEFRKSCSLSHAQRMVTAIRSYLRFLRFRGDIRIDCPAPLRLAGIKTKCKGAHLLRRTIATHALQAGATLPEVGELLRHRSIESTQL